MGNTQHSLISENNLKPESDRGKSMSPFTGTRSLINSKSPLRQGVNEKNLVTQNEWGGAYSTDKQQRNQTENGRGAAGQCAKPRSKQDADDQHSGKQELIESGESKQTDLLDYQNQIDDQHQVEIQNSLAQWYLINQYLLKSQTKLFLEVASIVQGAQQKSSQNPLSRIKILARYLKSNKFNVYKIKIYNHQQSNKSKGTKIKTQKKSGTKTKNHVTEIHAKGSQTQRNYNSSYGEQRSSSQVAAQQYSVASSGLEQKEMSSQQYQDARGSRDNNLQEQDEEGDIELLITHSAQGSSSQVKSVVASSISGLMTPQNELQLLQSTNMLKLIKDKSLNSYVSSGASTQKQQNKFTNSMSRQYLKSHSLIKQLSQATTISNNNNNNGNQTSIVKHLQMPQPQQSFTQTASLLKDKLKNSILISKMSPSKQERFKRPSLLERRSPNSNQIQSLEKSSLIGKDRQEQQQKDKNWQALSQYQPVNVEIQEESSKQNFQLQPQKGQKLSNTTIDPKNMNFNKSEGQNPKHNNFSVQSIMPLQKQSRDQYQAQKLQIKLSEEANLQNKGQKSNNHQQIQDLNIIRIQCENAMIRAGPENNFVHPSTQRNQDATRFNFDQADILSDGKNRQNKSLKSSQERIDTQQNNLDVFNDTQKVRVVTINEKEEYQDKSLTNLEPLFSNQDQDADELSLSNQSSSGYRDTAIKVFYDSQRYVIIKWSSKHTTLTCGWLISEIMRHLRFEEDFNKHSHIIGIKNMNLKASECYDYLLTNLESPLNFINNGDQLRIITLPEKFLLGSMTSVNTNFSPLFSEPTYLNNKSSSQNNCNNNSNFANNFNHNTHQTLALEDFEFVKVIGKGGFSKVFQVRKKDTAKIYAMKTLSKAKIKRDNKVENILNERAILEQVSHPFIIQMKYAFQNEDYLFLILEFCAGGELFYKLNNIPQGRMTEKQAKFYFAEILEAIQYIHDSNILYRDLKPENIVLDESGHVKLTDFGLSKLGFKMNDRAYSFCGSPEYMAPEMLKTEQNRQMGLPPIHHDKALDFYHLGALLHEMLCGLPPFFSEDRQKMYANIMQTPISFPAFLSNECQNLLSGLLQKDPSKRLGAKGGAQEIKDHPWCGDIAWDLVLKKEINPPFKPFMHRSNFDPEYTNMNPIVEDEDILVSLEDETKTPKNGEFLNEYENRIAKQKLGLNKNQNDQDEQMKQLNRQHSIEFYERENKTFRGYSFLQDPTINSYNPYINNQQIDHEGFYFCIADSKDQSFTVGSPIQEFDCLSDGEIVTLNNKPFQISQNQQPQVPQKQQNKKQQPAMKIDQDMMLLLQKESHNQQSQQSILSEGIEVMKANINQIQKQRQNNNKPGEVGKSGQTTKVQLNQNYLSKEGYKIISNNQQSKESLYNELLSTFDYSVSKKEKQIEAIKKNFNQTHSTMSLFSNSHQNHMGSYLGSGGPLEARQLKNPSRERRYKEDKKLGNLTLKEKLEFQKIIRKYSPEIDLQRALMQSKQKVANDYMQTVKKQQHLSKKSVQSNQSNQNNSSSNNNQVSIIKQDPSSSYLRTNSNNLTKNIQNDKKNSYQYNSEYNTFGNPQQNKFQKKKRGSETNSNRGTSPIDKTNKNIHKKQTSSKNSSSLQKSDISYQNSNSNTLKNQNTNNKYQQSNHNMNIQSNLKTSQLYSQIHSKVNQKKSVYRQQKKHDPYFDPNQYGDNIIDLQNQDLSINNPNDDNDLLEEEIKSRNEEFQMLDQANLYLNTNPSEKFIVKQITANDLLSSFLAQQSNLSIHHQFSDQNNNNLPSEIFKTTTLLNQNSNEKGNNYFINPVGDHTLLDFMGNSSLGSFSNERSFEETNEHVAALILNQSNESCCCSDDEFNNLKYNSRNKAIVTDSPRNLKISTNKNIKKLQYNALQESIHANQIKHKVNTQTVTNQNSDQKKMSCERKQKSQQRYILYKDPQRVFSDVQLPSHLEIQTNQISYDESVKIQRGSNSSMIDIKNLKNVSQSIAITQVNRLQQTDKQGKKSPSTATHVMSQRYNQGFNNQSQIQIKQLQSPISNTNQNYPQQMINILNKTTPISPMRERSVVASCQGQQNSKLKERPNHNPKNEPIIGQSTIISATASNELTVPQNNGNNQALNIASQTPIFSSTPRGSTRQIKLNLNSNLNSNNMGQSQAKISNQSNLIANNTFKTKKK